MRTLLSNKVTFSKIIFLMIVGLAAIAYNINLFTSDYNTKKKAISIEQVYYKWDKRKVGINEVFSLKNRIAEIKETKSKNAKSSVVMPQGAENSDKEKTKTVFAEHVSPFASITSVESVSDVKIKKDELIYVKFFNNEIIQQKDSVLSLASNEKIKVEFWLSPVNYWGYKKEKNKIILYGIEEFDEVNLKFAHRKICLKYKDRYFEIEENIDFQPFKPISDENIIAIINEDEEH